MSACDGCLHRAYLVAELAPRIAELLDRPGRRARAVLSLGNDDLIAAVGGGRADEVRERMRAFRAVSARAKAEAAEVGLVCRHDDLYPVPLRELADAPAVLFVAGSTNALRELGREPVAALVGTRQASPYGLEMARSLGRGLGAAGVPVVSGLALGIDGAAHRGCLQGDGLPVAVLAGGPDVPYPRSHAALYAKVRERGAVVAEMPPGRPAYRWSFPARNRIMAGLAQITVVVEAADPSGSLITADFAQDLGRTVGAVPGRATARVAAGSNALLAAGAALVSGPGDVLDELYGADEAHRAPPQPPPVTDPILRRALDALEAGAGIDAIARAAGLSAAQARAALSRLEAAGHVARAGLGGYRRCAGE